MRVSEYPVVDLAQLHRALGDETRLRILHLLQHCGELCVCEVEAILRISQSGASRHLNHLERASVIADRRDGAWVHYRLQPRPGPVVRAAVRQLAAALGGDPRAEADLARARRCRRGLVHGGGGERRTGGSR